MSCEPAWLPSGQTFIVSLVVSRIPAGKHREKDGAQALQSQDTGGSAQPCVSQLHGVLRKGAPCSPAVARQQGLGAKPWSQIGD